MAGDTAGDKIGDRGREQPLDEEKWKRAKNVSLSYPRFVSPKRTNSFLRGQKHSSFLEEMLSTPQKTAPCFSSIRPFRVSYSFRPIPSKPFKA